MSTLGRLDLNRALLARYDGRVVSEWFEESGHFPPLDARERFNRVFFDFLDSAS